MALSMVISWSASCISALSNHPSRTWSGYFPNLCVMARERSRGWQKLSGLWEGRVEGAVTLEFFCFSREWLPLALPPMWQTARVSPFLALTRHAQVSMFTLQRSWRVDPVFHFHKNDSWFHVSRISTCILGFVVNAYWDNGHRYRRRKRLLFRNDWIASNNIISVCSPLCLQDM